MKELTKLGYKIPLNSDSQKIIKELTIYPKETSKVKYSFQKPKPVLCYRKSKSSLYVPRYYGYTKFGEPEKKIKEPETKINIKFNGKIRDYQEKIVNVSIDKFKTTGGGILALGTGCGKCLAKDTPILMYDGSIKMVQDIKVGDKLMGDDSAPRNVLSLARGREEMYEIKPTKGESYTVNKSHILSLRCTADHSKKYRKGHILDISVEEYLKQNDKFKHMYKGYKVPVSFDKKEVPFDPYLLGLWLGDGTKKPGSNFILDSLRNLNLIGNKHIPEIYKCNSRINRLRLLAGLIDTDGILSKGNVYVIIQKNKKLSEDIQFLVRSLGFHTVLKECKKSCVYKGEKITGIYYRMCISGNIHEIPCLIPRKKAQIRKQVKNVLNYGFKVIPKGEDNYYGFEIDNNRRFVLGDFTVTHNTVITLYLIHKLGVKSLIIVHKENLLFQWIERINQFLPDARVGIIQGSKMEIQDKDIVIGMLQSLSMREYPDGTFDTFTFSAFDEVHCVNSKVFSKVLFKVQTKFRLGLSATPKRSDGLDQVTEYHIGSIMYTMSNTILDPDIHVLKAPNTGILSTTNYMGNVNLAKLVTDLSNSFDRNKILLEHLDFYSRQNRKIIVFSDRVSHCKYLAKAFNSLDNTKEASFFAGKMKKEEIDKAMEKDVICCTYSLTKEGFDLKELDTLMFATPRSDIVQAVGRILRQVNVNHPVVIDVVDSVYGTLKGQYYKRSRFYKSKNYKIFDLDNFNLVERNYKKPSEENISYTFQNDDD